MTVLSAMVGGLVPLLAGVIRAFLMGRLGWEFKFSGLDYIIYIISLVSSITIYRLSPFHPLSGFPGPWMLRVTKFNSAWVYSLPFQVCSGSRGVGSRISGFRLSTATLRHLEVLSTTWV